MEESGLVSSVSQSLLGVQKYCETENYKGWDPYDGLNSRIFQALPLKNWDVARLCWIQLFKRNPINLRRPFLVPKDYNAKGIGLLLNGYCNLYKFAAAGDKYFGNEEQLLEKIQMLADLLIQLQSVGYSGACWGYNFDWQSRRLFLFPKYTPTVVATAFCVRALLNAYEVCGKKEYQEIALSSANFVLNDLHQKQFKGGIFFSYSPIKGNDTVFNASLLGATILSLAYEHTGDQAFRCYARRAVKAACSGQQKDGSWVYGLLATQQWKDSFHSGYNLEAISQYQRSTGDLSFAENIKKGFKFYIKNFFLDDGTPKYYHDEKYPIDIHCPAQLFVTLSQLDRFKQNDDLARRVFEWTTAKMQSKRGYFYFQLKKTMSTKIPYMRWSTAFMFNALTYYLKEIKKNEV